MAGLDIGAGGDIDLERAEAGGKRLVLGGRDRLPGKAQHAMPPERAQDQVDIGIRQRPRQIDAVDSAAQGCTARCHTCHVFQLLLVACWTNDVLLYVLPDEGCAR